MYKKYITRNGKKTGPYYYESVRLKNGKIKTIYLGRTPNKDRLADKISKLKIDLESAINTGRTIVIPVESKIVKDALALAEIFNFERVITPIPVPEVNLEVPSPGKKDFNFETFLFMLISITYVFGFFYLEGSITGFAVAENVASTVNIFPILMGFVNLVLILFIYSDLRRKT